MPEPSRWMHAEDGGAPSRLVTQLRQLRASADDGKALTFRKLADRTTSSAPALNKAVNGRSVPTWEVVQDFVTGCGGDPEDYRELWKDARAEAARPTPAGPAEAAGPAEPDEAAEPATPVTEGSETHPRSWSPRGSITPWHVGALAAGVLLSAIAVVVLYERGGSSPVSEYVPVSRPSQHCTYYHHVVDGANVGSSYECTTNASLNTYHVWIVCSGSTTKLLGPSVPKGTPSIRDCPADTHPSVGGYDRDS